MALSPQEDDRKRVSEESRGRIVRTAASCADARNHIKSSREAIARSLETLARRFAGGSD